MSRSDRAVLECNVPELEYCLHHSFMPRPPKEMCNFVYSFSHTAYFLQIFNRGGQYMADAFLLMQFFT